MGSEVSKSSILRKSTWLELFFNLVVVAALGRVTFILTPNLSGEIFMESWVKFFVFFIPIWWVWVGYSLYSNIYDNKTSQHRFMVIALMSAILVMSVLANYETQKYFKTFVFMYVVARFIIVGFYISESKKNPEDGSDTVVGANEKGEMFFIGAMISFSSLIFEYHLAIVILLLGILFDSLTPFVLKHKLVKIIPNKEYLVNQVGFLAIMIIGHSIISILNGITSVVWDTRTIITAALSFAFLAMVWWVYFDSFSLLAKKELDEDGYFILFSQIIACLGIVILSNMLKHTIVNDLAINDFRVISIVGISMFIIGRQIADWFNYVEERLYMVRKTILVIAFAGAALSFSNLQLILLGTSFSIFVYIAIDNQMKKKASKIEDEEKKALPDSAIMDKIYSR